MYNKAFHIMKHGYCFKNNIVLKTIPYYVQYMLIITIMHNIGIGRNRLTEVILGAVLGSVFGMAVIALLTTFAVCWYR